eukprot:6113287-Pyramimonas_sp.AAC.1
MWEKSEKHHLEELDKLKAELVVVKTAADGAQKKLQEEAAARKQAQHALEEERASRATLAAEAATTAASSANAAEVAEAQAKVRKAFRTHVSARTSSP